MGLRQAVALSRNGMDCITTLANTDRMANECDLQRLTNTTNESNCER